MRQTATPPPTQTTVTRKGSMDYGKLQLEKNTAGSNKAGRQRFLSSELICKFAGPHFSLPSFAVKNRNFHVLIHSEASPAGREGSWVGRDAQGNGKGSRQASFRMTALRLLSFFPATGAPSKLQGVFPAAGWKCSWAVTPSPAHQDLCMMWLHSRISDSNACRELKLSSPKRPRNRGLQLDCKAPGRTPTLIHTGSLCWSLLYSV